MKNSKAESQKFEKPTTEIYCVNWERLLDEDGAEFVVNMMICLNDLLSNGYLDSLATKDAQKNKIPDATNIGNQTYLLRMKISLIFEAHKYFASPKSKQSRFSKFLKEFHSSHPTIAAQYERFQQLCRDNKFKGVAKLRNAFGYHLNYDSDSKLTKEALRKRYSELSARGEQYFVLPGLQVSDNPLLTRCILADTAIGSAIRQAFGNTPDSDSFEEEETRSTKMYLKSLGQSLLDWLESFIETYLEERNLLID